MKTENAHDTTHSKSPANAKRRALLCCSLFGARSVKSVGGSEDSGVSRVSRIERLPNAREPRGRTPPARRRARSPVSPRLTSARVSSRAVPPVQRTERRAGRGGAPLLSSSSAGSHDSNRLRRARAETREDDQVIAPRERHRPARPRIVHRRARSVAGCVSRLARPAPSPHRGQISTLELSRVPRKRAAAVTRAPADPLDPCALLSTRAEAVLGSRLTDDAIWPTPSAPAKVRRAPSRSLERHDVSFARERRKTTTNARAKRCALRAKNG